jgi:hypothetical protein
MIKVFESFDFSRVGRVQSLLESNGIPTFVKNQFASSVMGEVPFVEVCPQLFILNRDDLADAQQLIAPELEQQPVRADWRCAACGAEVGGEFALCWSCGVAPAAS